VDNKIDNNFQCSFVFVGSGEFDVSGFTFTSISTYKELDFNRSTKIF